MHSRRRSSEMMTSYQQFINAMKDVDTDLAEGLWVAFWSLSKGCSNARVTAHVLKQAMDSHVKLTDDEVFEVTSLVKKERINNENVNINCDELKSIIKFGKFLATMKEHGDSEKGLEDAFDVLDNGRNIAPLTDYLLQYVMKQRGVELTIEEVGETIRQVIPTWKEEKGMTLKEFDNIFDRLKRVGRFFEAIKKDEGIEAALHILSRGKATAPITANVLHHVMKNCGIEQLNKEQVTESALLVKPKWKDGEEITWRELETMVKFGRFLAAAETGKELKDVFDILSEGKTVAPITCGIFVHLIPNLPMPIEQAMKVVKPGWNNEQEISFDDFNSIVKGLKRLKKFFQDMKEVDMMKVDVDDKNLKAAFNKLKEGTDKDTAVITANVFECLIKQDQNIKIKLKIEEVVDAILLVINKQDSIDLSSDDFTKIIKWLVRLEKFLEAIKDKDSKGLNMEDFKILISDGDNKAPLISSYHVLSHIMEIRQVKYLTAKDVEDILHLVNPDWKGGEKISFNDFNQVYGHLDKFRSFFMEAAANDDNNKLEKAFPHLLSEGQTDVQITANVLRYAMEIKKIKLTTQEVVDTISTVKSADKDKAVSVNLDEFTKMIKLLEERSIVGQLKNIHGTLSAKERDFIVLHGKSGVGKTWMAKKVALKLTRDGRFDAAIWIYPKATYGDRGLTLQHSIANQLSLDIHKAEQRVKDKQQKKKEQKSQEDDDKEKRIVEELEEMIREEVKNKHLLLIYDENNDQESEVKSIIGEDRETNKPYCTKLVTTQSLEQHQEDHKCIIQVWPWTQHEAQQVVGGGDDHDDELEVKELANYFINKTERHPIEVLVITKTVNHFKKSRSGTHKMRMIQKGGSNDVIQLLIKDYDLIPRRILIDCYSSINSEKHFLHKGANYQELISYWIVEGHLDKFDRIEDAYEEGYRVLTELLDCGLLRKQEGSFVMASSRWKKFNYDILDYDDFFKGVQLGMGNTFDCKLGRIAVADGMMRTIGIAPETELSSNRQKREKRSASGQEREKLSTLILDGNHFQLPGNRIFEQLPANVFTDQTLTEVQMQTMSELEKIGFLEPQLEILVIFNPTTKPFPLPVEKLEKLRLLVLRGCRYLKKSNEIFQLEQPQNESLPNPGLFKRLEVLEISGPSPLDELPEFLFTNKPGLKSVNFSSLQIKSLPKSFYLLKKVEFLIIKNCTSLQDLESLENFTELQLLDLSGSTSLHTFKEKNFKKNMHIQIINFSNTNLDRVPLVHSLGKLISLKASGCTKLRGIRKVSELQKLRIFDISGSTRVQEFLDPQIKKLDSIEVLDVSRTSIKKLPGNIGNPRFLYAKDCSQLTELLPIKSLQTVQVLDFSGCCKLTEIKDDFFQEMKSLRELNLSKTNIENLPSLSSPPELRCLQLSYCQSLKNIDKLSSLENLEVLDLSGCGALVEIKGGSFDKMKHLETLDLSELKLVRLPSLSKLKKLKQLKVRDCPKLKVLPGIEELKVLESLDHSGTTLNTRTSFKSPLCRPTVTGPVAAPLEFHEKILLQDLGCSISHDRDGAEKEVVAQEECNWKISGLQGGELGTSHDGIHALELFKKLYLSQFHFLIVPSDEQNKPNKSSYKDELSLRDLYLKQVHMPKCLEIRGFNKSPNHVQGLLEEAESVVLIDNPFCQSLFDLISSSDKEQKLAMKLCWIERCNEMKYVTCSAAGERFSDLETLWVSHVQKLESITDGNAMRLKKLYLEFCPLLSQITSQLRDLEILRIRYCRKLVDTSFQAEKLTELDLWGLPALKEIRCSAPLLKTLRVGDCCLLQHVICSRQEKLETLGIKSCDKVRTICESSDKGMLPALRELELWALPELQTLFAEVLRELRVGECHSLDEVPGAGISILEIKSCNGLKRIKGLELHKTEKMELMCLPELEMEIDDEEDNPKHVIWGCPKLKKKKKMLEVANASMV